MRILKELVEKSATTITILNIIKTMKNSVETIVDDNGIEVLVDYDYELNEAYYAEIGNPATFVPASVDDSSIKINSFEIVIGERD